MKRLITVLLCMSLSACAMSPARFSPGEVDPKQFSKDEYECERDAKMMPNSDSCGQMDMFERCMRSKGYKPTDSGSKGMCAMAF